MHTTLHGAPIREDGERIACPGCGERLGHQYPQLIHSTNRGRVWIGVAFAIRCERCGGVWLTPSLEGQATADSPLKRLTLRLLEEPAPFPFSEPGA